MRDLKDKQEIGDISDVEFVKCFTRGKISNLLNFTQKRSLNSDIFGKQLKIEDVCLYILKTLL